MFKIIVIDLWMNKKTVMPFHKALTWDWFVNRERHFQVIRKKETRYTYRLSFKRHPLTSLCFSRRS